MRASRYTVRWWHRGNGGTQQAAARKAKHVRRPPPQSRCAANVRLYFRRYEKASGGCDCEAAHTAVGYQSSGSPSRAKIGRVSLSSADRCQFLQFPAGAFKFLGDKLFVWKDSLILKQKGPSTSGMSFHAALHESNILVSA